VGKALQPPFVPMPPRSLPGSPERQLRSQTIGYALFALFWAFMSFAYFRLDIPRERWLAFFGVVAALGWALMAGGSYLKYRSAARAKS
jgi:hypothetical protein